MAARAEWPPIDAIGGAPADRRGMVVAAIAADLVMVATRLTGWSAAQD